MQQSDALTKLPERYDPYWKALNDKQVEEARQRDQEEQMVNQRLRSNYREELVKLIEEKQRQKHEQQLQERQQDHHLVERSLELQKVHGLQLSAVWRLSNCGRGSWPK